MHAEKHFLAILEEARENGCIALETLFCCLPLPTFKRYNKHRHKRKQPQL